MISYISKIAGLGLLGVGAIGTSIAYGVSQLSSKELSVLLSEEDRKWQFLHELSKKVFNFLKRSKKREANEKDNVIKWLKDKFAISLENEEDKWENFKFLCEEQNPKENGSGIYVYTLEARLCFLDKLSDSHQSKGNLNLWSLDNGLSEFKKWDKFNYKLWELFNHKHSNSNPVDKFYEWYDEEDEILKIRDILR